MTLILLAVGLSGCNELSNSDEDKLFGIWNSFDNPSLTFFSDGTDSMYGQSVTWDIPPISQIGV